MMDPNVTPLKRVYLVDRQSLFVDSLTQLLSLEPDFGVVGAATDSDRAFRDVAALEPDIIISDIELPGRGAMTLATEVRRRFPAIKFVFLAGYMSHVCVDEALRIDVHGFLLKSDPVVDVIGAVRHILEGDTCYSADVKRTLSVDSETNTYRVDSMNELSRLTSRQLEVLRQLTRGRSVKEVARTMSLSQRAVESQKYRIMRKLKIHDRVELAMFAVREGLLVPQ